MIQPENTKNTETFPIYCLRPKNYSKFLNPLEFAQFVCFTEFIRELIEILNLKTCDLT